MAKIYPQHQSGFEALVSLKKMVLNLQQTTIFPRTKRKLPYSIIWCPVLLLHSILCNIHSMLCPISSGNNSSQIAYYDHISSITGT